MSHMPEQYAHTLVPERVNFAPRPQQVSDFFSGLVRLGTAPLEATVEVMKLSGRSRSFTDSITGEARSWPLYDHVALQSITNFPDALTGLGHYNAVMAGQGPPPVPPFSLDYTGKTFTQVYSFNVRCCLRADVVSTSDWHPEISTARTVPSFGEPCTLNDRIGVFHHPSEGTIIEVPNAGCARFWIEFEFGKWLVPKIHDNLNLLVPVIIRNAEEHFATKFVQGCRWYA